ncbi:DUF2478 domain-containing protein [Defluviimonas sp. WL0024]|uniref:DUF2478 domain-containing protein n=1 Tax=Albidovulum salinarum TaxID=2984153 RepID=A0ABT2X4H3_9RHOB|nr:DUF2478 domain-containing protein [Defluviimonas sp. WL0024]MCU9848848.1 DUF2478 domain-containing protein [Defluviimonas sp. WL0024]
MLGYVIAEGRGAADRVLAEVARQLHDEGWPLAGAVQVNSERGEMHHCDMDLHVLAADRIVRISQNLGALAKGCRLDPSGLEQAVGIVEAALDATPRPRLLIVNKFGKQEIDGRGFRPVIGRALASGVPVLTAVNAANLPGFEAFAHEFAEPIPLDFSAILGWCRNAST